MYRSDFCRLHTDKNLKNWLFFFNWYSLHAKLNSYYEAWKYKKKKHKKIKTHKKSFYKEPTVKMCLLVLDLKPFKS